MWANSLRFLLAQLYIDMLVGKRSPAALRTGLKGLRKATAVSPNEPSALDEAYNKALERIQQQRGDLPRDALLILSWIVNAKRQITVPELRDALAVEIGKSALDEDNVPTIEHVTRACAPLIVVDGESNIVRLVHYTTQEYLERTQNIWFQNAQIDITNISLTYLSFSVFKSGFCPSQAQFDDRVKTNNLYRYAAENWGHHAREALKIGLEAIVIVDFLESEMKREASSQALMVTEYEYIYDSSQRVPRQVTALHLAAYFGLYDVVVMLLEKGHSPHIKDTKEITPLLWACRNGHAQIVKLLLEKNVNPELKDNVYDRTPLSWAAMNGHEPVVKLLLEKAVDLESKDRFGLTPLEWAARNGHAAVLELLLESGAVSDAKSNSHGENEWRRDSRRAPTLIETSLSWAARNGHEMVVKLLLGEDVNQEAKCKLGLTPLAWAARNGHEVVTKLLLDNMADINAQDAIGTTVLHWVAWRGHEAVMSLLLQHGANTETKNAGGGTALAAAIEKGYEKLAQLLLENGASQNYRYPLYQSRTVGRSINYVVGRAAYVVLEGYKWGSPGWFGIKERYYEALATDEIYFSSDVHEWVPQRQVSPLWRAAEKSDDAIMKLLLNKGAQMDFKDRDGYLDDEGSTQFPLLWAAKNGFVSVVRLLHERGDDVNAKAVSGDGAMSVAARIGRETVVSLLLTLDKVDADKKDEDGRTPLSYAAENGHKDVVAVLLASGKVDADSNDHNGRTPLSHVSRKANGIGAAVVKLLVAADHVNVDSKDDTGRTPLSYAAERGNIPAMKLLVSSGKADVNSKDKSGRTPLSYLYFGITFEADVKFLLASSGVDIESRDNIGRTPLSYAASKGHVHVIRLLVEHGADRNSKDESGQTPLLRARESFNVFKKEGKKNSYRHDYENAIRLLELPYVVSSLQSTESLSDLTRHSNTG
jgi:ankyrin repeat protein